MSFSARTLNRLGVFGAAILFSTGGAAIKACSLTNWQVAGFRSGIAAVAMYALIPKARPVWTKRTTPTALAYAATLILFVAANKLTTSANAIFLQSTAPLYLLLLGPLMLREPIRKIDLVVIAAIGCGAVLLLSGSELMAATAPDPSRGNIVAAFSGVAWALTIAGLRWLEKQPAGKDSGTATVIAGNTIAFALCLPMALPLAHASFKDAALLLYLGIFQIGLAYTLLTHSLMHVPALEAATLLLLEPVLNPQWTWLIHGERPSTPALAGGALIIFTAFAATWWQSGQMPLSTERAYDKAE